MSKLGKCLIAVLSITIIFIAAEFFKDDIVDTVNKPIASSSNGSVMQTETKYWYNKLTENEKQAYDNVYSEILSFPNKIAIPKLDSKELENVFVALSYDNPKLFFLSKFSSIMNRGFKYYFIPQYIMSKEQYEKDIAKVENIIEDVKAKTSGMSDYQKELYIHDYIASNCEYYDGDSEVKFTVYGALINGLANCEGYSRSVQLLLNEVKVNCRIIVGDATNQEGKTEGHMWNIVTLNSKQYNLDATWDDYTLIDMNKIKITPSHMYFNVPTIDISSSHKATPTEDYKNCVYDEDNYFNVSGVSISKYDSSSKKIIVSEIANQLTNGATNIELKFENKDVYNTALEKLFNGQEIYRLISRANLKTDNDVSNKSVNYTKIDDKLIIRIFFN